MPYNCLTVVTSAMPFMQAKTVNKYTECLCR